METFFIPEPLEGHPTPAVMCAGAGSARRNRSVAWRRPGLPHVEAYGNKAL